MTKERDDRLPWVKMILRMEAEYEADLLSRAVETMKDMDTQRPLKPMIFVSTPNGWKQILEISERCE
jgi:hypothetical protein